jgi:hypothetical protein
MRRINYLGLIAGTISAFGMACSDPPVTPDGGGGDTGGTPGQTFTYVIDNLSIDMTDNPDVPHTGFNLDNLFSSDIDAMGCTHADYFSTTDNDQHCSAVTNEMCTVTPNTGCARTATGCKGGVDNQLPTLANTVQTALSTDIRMTIADTIANNSLALLIRVSDVNDTMNDSSVRVAIYRAFPTFNAGCTAVAANREYSVDSSFLSAGATNIDTGATVAFDGSIVNGRLQVRAGGSSGVFNLPISFSGYTLNLPLNQVQFRGNVSATEIATGNLGGWVGGEEVITAVRMIAPSYEAVVRGVIGGLVDIQVQGICDGSAMMPPRYGGIAVGFAVHAIPATISTTTPIATTQAAGTCGYTAPGDGGAGG